MKTPKELIESACNNNLWVGKKSDLEQLVKDAIMYSFQNTSEDFNMETIQGDAEMTNDIIYEMLNAPN